MADGALMPAQQAPIAVCLDCRTAMARVGSCDCGQGRVVELGTSKGRTALGRAVWGATEGKQKVVIEERVSIVAIAVRCHHRAAESPLACPSKLPSNSSSTATASRS